MPFETFAENHKRIAIIGGGITGLSAAHLLAKDHAVVLFESDRRLGGHAMTVTAGKRGDQPVDMGFIVFNKVNYPNLTRLFEKLDVPVAKSEMSFGCSVGGGRLEYGLRDLGSLFCQARNVVDPRYLRMLRDMWKFHKSAGDYLQDGMTLRDLLAAMGTGRWFSDYYITPFTGAIWSTPVAGILDFPALPMIQFFTNHGLMGVWDQHQWYTVQGGSVEYVRRLSADLARQGVELRTGAPVKSVRRAGGGVMLRAEGAEWEMFDEVIFATHSDDALALLEDPTATERQALSAILYQPNEAVLHADASVMPRAKKAWSSWNYVEPAGPRPDKVALTYWMNSLQPIPQDDPLFVTLNPTMPINPALVHHVQTFRHPVFDLGALAAQTTLRGINGQNATWFAGAWMRNGFHEDGFVSALDVVNGMRARAEVREAA
jgi:uncharacterized protein